MNVLSLSLSDLSDVKDIEFGDRKISLRFLFKIIFGFGIEKNGTEYFDGEIDDPKYEGTQIYEFYQLIKAIRKEDKSLDWFQQLKKDPPSGINMDKFSFNRISETTLDRKFLFAMRRNFKDIDGYYAPKISSNWNRIENIGSKRSVNKYSYIQHEELAIYNGKKLEILKTFIKDTDKLCDIILS